MFIVYFLYRVWHKSAALIYIYVKPSGLAFVLKETLISLSADGLVTQHVMNG